MFRNFPLENVHPHAERAAEAAEAAGAQDRFWEMHDRLFENQRSLEDEDLERHAAEVGLDLSRFEQEMAERVHEPQVREDLEAGFRSGISGTPAFFINGVRHEGSYRFAELLAAVEAAESAGPGGRRG